MAKEIPRRPGRSAKNAPGAQESLHAPKGAPPASNDPKRAPPPIAGIGASAGGLEAFTRFLKHLPPDSGIAFVLIQHLDARHHSQLAEILTKATAMPVTEIRADMHAEANHVYVISPNECLAVTDGHLRVEPRGPGRNLPIDYFFRSLAEAQGSRALGVVLSGTASDGTLGLKAIKAEGGITFVQEPSSAKFDGMPRSAMAAGVADFVLTPEQIAKRLVAIARNPYVILKPEEAVKAEPDTELELNKIFGALRAATGNDFTHYKHTTIRRRVQRRMVLHSFEKLGDYLGYLQQNPSEMKELANDLFIRVTSFFREPEALRALAEKAFPSIIKNRPPDDPIRIWVPGCATGEEAYSIVICLTEFLESSGVSIPLQVFATDVSETALEKARSGIYLESALADVSPQRLERFFTKIDSAYQIQKTVRDVCVFAKQNIAKDPPFSRLDLISCCNVLIYFDPVLQRKVLSMFHYALKPAGFLMLGSSESVGPFAESFRQVSKKQRLYAKQPAAESPALNLDAREPASVKHPGGDSAVQIARVALDLQKTADRILLNEYAPAGVIVDDSMRILQVRGHTGPYLELAPGEPTNHLLKMAREGLVVGLRAALRKVAQNKSAITHQAKVKHNGEFREVNLRVIPINGSVASKERHFLVLFEDVKTPPAAEAKSAVENKPKGAGQSRTTGNIANRENARLKQELAATREYLQEIVEEQEAATEELKSANEEAQATNEELETAKEELQSANEELNTLNDELRTRNAALAEVNADLTNVLTSINIPLVMVGKDLRIRRFTQAIEPMLNLIESDVGRSISDLKPNIAVPDLPDLLREAIHGGSPNPREITDLAGKWYSLQALPYKAPSGKVDGALLVLFNIDAVKRGRDYAESIIETLPQPVLALNPDLKVRTANRAFYQTFQVSKTETENHFIYDLGNGQWDIPNLRQLLENILPERSSFNDFEIDHRFERIGRKTMLLSARIMGEPEVDGRTILLAIVDITERVRAEKQLREANERLKQYAYAASHDLQEPLRMVVSYSQLLARDYEGKLEGNADKYIRYTMESARRMEALLKGMREYWQASERGPEPLIPVNCNDALAKALLNLQQAIGESGATVIRGELPTVLANETMLVQLFQNLVGNALKYSRDEAPRIEISAGKDSGGDWVFSIKDNGIGIDPEHHKDIFEIFSRLNGGKYPGAGMGLAICGKLIENLGGRIWAESEPGHGSTFKFTIPAAEAK